MSNHQEIFAKRLKQARENKAPALSQRGAARLLGFSQSAISLWELGKNMPELNVMVKLADFYGVSLEWLTGTVEAPKLQTTQEINAVPLVALGDLAQWWPESPMGIIQSTHGYLPSCGAAVEITSDALPSICHPGDIAIVERDQKLVPNGIYFIQFADRSAPTLRRCSFDGSDIYFVTEVGIPPTYYEAGIKVVGRVREIVRRTLL